MMTYARAILKHHPGTILGVDQTFLLAACYVSVVTLQVPNIQHGVTKKSPVVGIMYLLQWKAIARHYRPLFQALKDELVDVEDFILKASDSSDEISDHCFKIGSVQEKAIRKALLEVMPNAKQIL